MHVEFAEDLGCVEEVLVLEDPVQHIFILALFRPTDQPLPSDRKINGLVYTYFFPFQANNGRFNKNGTQYPLIKNRIVRNA